MGLANILAVAIAQVDGLDNAGQPKILSGMWRVLYVSLSISAWMLLHQILLCLFPPRTMPVVQRPGKLTIPRPVC